MGYLRFPDGKIVTFCVPNATYLVVNGLNDGGELVGSYTDKVTNANRAFIRHANGKVETFALNGAAGYISAKGVNEGGVCGFYGRPGGKTTTFSYPPNGVLPFQINDRGVIAGGVLTASGKEDYFIRKPDGKMILFGLANTAANTDTTICSINNEDEVVGAYDVYVQVPPPLDQIDYRYDFVRYPDGKIATYDPPSDPGSLQGTVINNRGVIAGRAIPQIEGGKNGLFLMTPKHCIE